MSNLIPFPEVDGWDFDVPVRDVPKVILAGLRSAGVKAEQGKAWHGKYPTLLDLVIDIDCPEAHLSRDGLTFAKVRLLVDPRKGTLTVQRHDERGNGCPRCDQQAIDCWLVTCQRHDEHPDHEPGWISVDDFPDDTPEDVIARIIPGGDEGRGDDSPMGHVFEAMMKAEGEAKALLRAGVKQVGSTAIVIKDLDAGEWLAEQKKADGSPLVPPTLGQNATWDRVKGLPGCPTQALVRDAQAKRRAE